METETKFDHDDKLMEAVTSGSVDDVKLLCSEHLPSTKFGSYVKKYVDVAAKLNFWDIVEFFVGHSGLAHHAMILAAKYNNVDMIENLKSHWLLRKYSAETLFTAITHGHFDLVMHLVKNGINFRTQNDMAMTKAAESGNKQMLNFFIRATNPKTAQIHSLLIILAEKGCDATFEYLFKKIIKLHQISKDQFNHRTVVISSLMGNNLKIFSLIENFTKETSTQIQIGGREIPYLLTAANCKDKNLLSHVYDKYIDGVFDYDFTRYCSRTNPKISVNKSCLEYCAAYELYDTMTYILYAKLTKKSRAQYFQTRKTNTKMSPSDLEMKENTDYLLEKTVQKDFLLKEFFGKNKFLKFILKPSSLHMQLTSIE
jgi:hypothetical protein